MPLRLADLSTMQIRALCHLDDGLSHHDSVGVRVGETAQEWLEAAESLQTLGLAQLSFGWRGTFWLHLTPDGRAILNGTKTG